jgi:hypothetical protein
MYYLFDVPPLRHTGWEKTNHLLLSLKGEWEVGVGGWGEEEREREREREKSERGEGRQEGRKEEGD